MILAGMALYLALAYICYALFALSDKLEEEK